MAKNNSLVTKSSQLVTIRQNELADGTISLYLDIHHNGKRTREYLKLYLHPGNTRVIKETNRVTLAQAEAIRAERQIQIQNGQYEAMQDFKPNTYFLPYYRKMCEARYSYESLGNWGNWRSALRYLEQYCDDSTTFADITPEWLEGFKEFLEYVEKDTKRAAAKKKGTMEFAGLSQNSKHSYFCKVKACINQAFDEHIIMVNPLHKVKGFKSGDPKREYLTWDEVVALANTPCRNAVLKRAFLFSCFSGLRKSDIIELTWGQIREFDGMTRIVFEQVKTGGMEYLDLPDQAVLYLGARRDPKDKIFAGFHYGNGLLAELRRWCLKAGITKDITFHCGRHTFAVLLLEFGADIYTVSKMLGHRQLSTTEVYAKVVDKKKREAVSKFPDFPTPPSDDFVNQ